jgi:hypothetical protein
MFDITDTIPEPYSDEIGAMLSKIKSHDYMTNRKRKLIAELKLALTTHQYISFNGYSHRYHLSRIGTSYLYDVPANKTGKLKVFRGNRIRLICSGSGPRWVRQYMAGIV